MSDVLDQIRRLYYEATRATIDRDFDRAIDLLKTMASEQERERATVYMQGLAEMKSEWRKGPSREKPRKPQAGRPTLDDEGASE